MSSKYLKHIVIGLVGLVILVGAFSGGLIFGMTMPLSGASAIPLPLDFQEDSTSNNPVIQEETSEVEDLDALFTPFWEAWEIVNDQYVEQPVDPEYLMRGAIRGMMRSLEDPYTSYMDPDQYQQQSASLDGDYEGIGAWVDITGEYLAIISPMPDSPAEKAGLKPGDIVVGIDGEDMTGIPGNLVLRRILGPAGTEVTLTIIREGEQDPFDVTIVRQNIVIPSVDGEILEDNIAYIQLFTFGEDTARDLENKIEELFAQSPKGLVLDLRNNSGGYLNSAVDVVTQFIEPGKVVLYQEYGDGARQTWKTGKGGKALDIPLVVLVNGGTASASEITAGAIQDYGRGKLVGTTTFGKGLVQNWIPLKNNEGAVSVTIAYWLTPNDRQIHEQGLEPDFIVELTDEDFEAERDPQLDKAVELLGEIQ